MSKMTDEQIKKGLECCRKYPLRECKKCPYLLEMACDTTLKIDLIDLINRQQAEIERLKEELEIRNQKRANIFEISNAFERGRTKAIKEFAERLKDILAIEVTVEYEIADGFFKDFFDITETFNEIDNLVKEMVGEQE